MESDEGHKDIPKDIRYEYVCDNSLVPNSRVDLFRVLWTSCENYLVVMSDNDVMVLNQEDNSIVGTFKHDCRLNDIVVHKSYLLVACSNAVTS